MDTQKKIKQLESRADRTEYTGKFNSFQEFGSSFKGKRYSAQYEKDPYSEYQNFLYKRALYGLKMYTKKELKSMHKDKRKRIERVNSRAQKSINMFKQEILIKTTNVLLGVFKKESLAGEIVDLYSTPDPKFISKTPLKDLGITKDMVVDRLIEDKVLPQNFKSLK